MFRRIFNSVNSSLIEQTSAFPSPFTKPDTVHFNWLTNCAPCFPIKSCNIKILQEPQQFYDCLLIGCKNAKKRITLVSLYLGNGELERKLVNALMSNENLNKLNIRVLIDYTRGSRCENNSRSILQPLVKNNVENCKVRLYHTPELRGVLKKFMPNRWNELLGLQHMKLYIFDDTLLISGANLSNDYFTNRQDRYFVINDKNLCDFYQELVHKVQKFSLQMDGDNRVGLNSNWGLSPYEGNKKAFINAAGDAIDEYLIEKTNEQNCYKKEGFDTWVFPLVQMGQLGVNQDELITNRILLDAPQGAKLQIASGYFNLTKDYMSNLIQSKAQCNILMAHPNANGFLNAKGAAGGIPYAYSLIAKKFQYLSEKTGQNNRIRLLEYFRPGWTYHAKGLWYYGPNNQLPCLTLIGSPNFGERSVKKDLETQLAIVTENNELKNQLHEECQRLYKLGSEAELNRPIPAWVKAMVFFFRAYF